MPTLLRFGLSLILLIIVPSVANAADKAFHRDNLAVDAARYEKELKAKAALGDLSAAEWRRAGERARGRDDHRTAAQNYANAAVADPDDWSTWLALSETLLAIETDDWRERNAFPQNATSAAFIAYQRADTPWTEARALATLGLAFARREIWRPALDALKASIDTAPIDWVQATYDDLRARHGFRVLDYTVDSEAASPRACIQFSEPLLKARDDYAPFVSVAGIDAPVIAAENASLCVDGLKHGERYEITVREGVPSEVDEVLQNSTTIVVYVRDRSPSVRFTGRNYVLPRSGQRGVPMVTVNTDNVAIELYRVGDRALAPTVLDGGFQRQLDAGDIERLGDETGAKVWAGEMQIDDRLNEDVTTAFAVDEAIGDLQPGVYVMVATPKNATLEYWDQRATQWFVVSDLGLAAISAEDGLHGFVRSLASAEGLAGVPVRLIARNNEVLTEAVTDDRGYLRIAPGFLRGEGGTAPGLLVADAGGGDYAFLDLTQPAFDLSDRGVEGRVAPGPLDAFVFTERGVYRSGETVHATALLRDAAGKAVSDLPLTLVVDRPDGVEHRRITLADQGLGGRTLDLDLLSSAMTGTWRIEAFADPKAKPIGSTTFLVEDYVPDRVEFDISADREAIAPGASVNVTVDGRYLYGAPAAGLSLDGEIVVKAAAGLAAHKGYQFGLSDEDVTPVRAVLADLPETGADGAATAAIDLPALPVVTRPLEADIVLRLGEPGGRAVEKTLTLPIARGAPMIGIKPGFDGRVGEGETAKFQVIALDADGNRMAAAGLKWELYRLETRYQWYARYGSWDYETLTFTTRVADGVIDAGTETPAEIAASVDWGRYRLDVSGPGPDGPMTSVTFSSGWYAVSSADTPDVLDVALDRETYRTGETAIVDISPRFAGTAVVAVIGETMRTLKVVDIPAEGAEVELTVGDDWAPGAYVTVMLYRPLDVEAGRMPSRAVGLAWLGVDRAPRLLSLNLDVAEQVRPNAPLSVPVKISGLAPGEPARLVVAAVDVGILNLTGYEPPAPDAWYFGQRALSAEFRDLYGSLIDGMRAPRGRIRSGGDGLPQAGLQGRPPAQAPLALFSGLVDVGDDGSAEISFDLPAFAGTVRVMAVAWSAGKLGHAATDVIVRDPVVLLASMPRFMAVGDQAALRLDLANTDGPAGEYQVTVGADGPLLVSDQMASTAVSLEAGARRAVTVPIDAVGVGTATLIVELEGPDGLIISRDHDLGIVPANAISSRRSVSTLAARGGKLTVSGDLLSGIVPGTGKVTLAVGPGAGLDLPGLIAALDRYAYGCAEQTTSRALPLLYLADVAARAGLTKTEPRARINEAIARVLALQSSTGAFGLWRPGDGDLWLDAYVTDFLTRARERGFSIPDRAYGLALERLGNAVAITPEVEGGGEGLAYALYVLARNGRAPIGDLRYFADTKIDDFATGLARAQIGAALAMTGDTVRAERTFTAAMTALAKESDWVGRGDYGSELRDAAAALTLVSETGLSRGMIPTIAARIDAANRAATYTSTQEKAWMVLAAHALGKEAGRIDLDVGGADHSGSLVASYGAIDFRGGDITVTNRGDEAVSAVVSVTGAPTTPDPAAANGFALSRQYFTLDGVEVDPAEVAQNARLIVALTVEEEEPQNGRLLLVDRLPAGLEIDNPTLVGSANLSNLPWLTEEEKPRHAEFRDDRFVAAIDRTANSPRNFTVAYMVRAVSPGRFAHPAAFIEDMYWPDRFARTAAGKMAVEAAR